MVRKLDAIIAAGVLVAVAGFTTGSKYEPTQELRNAPSVKQYEVHIQQLRSAEDAWSRLPDNVRDEHIRQEHQQDYSVSQAHSEVEPLYQSMMLAQGIVHDDLKDTSVEEFVRQNEIAGISYIAGIGGVLVSAIGFKYRFPRP
jgi:hypothetical protein